MGRKQHTTLEIVVFGVKDISSGQSWSCSAGIAGTRKARCLGCCAKGCSALVRLPAPHPHHPSDARDPPTPPTLSPSPRHPAWSPFTTPRLYARFLLPSRFRKLEGLSFISANWMEYSWPFQWNQLTP